MSVNTIMGLVNKNSGDKCFHDYYTTFVLDWFNLAKTGREIALYIDDSYEEEDNDGNLVTAYSVKEIVERLCKEEKIKLPKITLC